MNHSPNGRSLDIAMTSVAYGTVYAQPVDDRGNPIGLSESLGYNISMSIANNKETQVKEHTNFDRRVEYANRVTKIAPVLTVEFKEFSMNVMKKFINSDVKVNAAGSVTLDFVVTKDSLTQDRGFFYPIKGGINAVTSITFGEEGETATPALPNIHYVIQNGSLAFLSLKDQTLAGASVLLDPTLVDLEIKGTVTTLASESTEYESKPAGKFALYIENYNGDYLEQYWIHNVTAVMDTLPLKADSEDDLTYSVAFNMLAANNITDPALSPFMSWTRTKISNLV